MSTPDSTRSVRPTRAGTVIGGLVLAAVVSTALNALVAAVAHAAGASGSFNPLMFPAYTFFGVIGLLIGAAGWAIVRARAARPRVTLRTLVPLVLVVSFVPDILVGISGSMAGTSWGAVIALMVMHVIVAVVAVATYARILPLPEDRQREAEESYLTAP